uniref:Agrin n=1 Tax=Caenorhabditis japonica TaxID=281687 RepID=A0A8R1EUP9_CAEJA
MDHLGMAANMTVCGSDGTTYTNLCELKMFACKHQIDVVPVSMGICDDENFEVLDRLQREQNLESEKRLGSSCTRHEECEKLDALCITRPGRKSVCDCDDGWKSRQGVCVEQARRKKSDRLDLNTDLLSDWVLVRKGVTRYSKLSMHIHLKEKKHGTLLRMMTEDRKVGDSRVESLQTIAYNVSLELKWKQNEVQFKLNGETQKAKFDDVLDSSVKKIFLASDGKWERSRLNSTIGFLEINDVPVRIGDVKPFYMPSEISRVLKFNENGFLKLESLKMEVRQKSYFEIVFKSEKSNGLLFYWSVPSDQHTDFVGFAMIDAKPHFVYELGSGLSYIRGGPIALNSWHSVRIERFEKQVSMFVNETLVKKQQSQVG